MKKSILFFLTIIMAMTPILVLGQVGVTIEGRVTDAQGNPLPGANVIIKDTEFGTAAGGRDGAFEFTLPAGMALGQEVTLEAQFIGFHSKAVQITLNPGTITQNFALTEDVIQLSSIVVTALGFKVDADKQGSTSSAVSIQAMARSGEPLMANSLSAKASNVIVNATTGDPGAGTSITIRGANTISRDTGGQPLIILDGIPIDNSYLRGSGDRDASVAHQSRINDINVNDIESVQVLKSASAAALWGSRAANGVIMITTKSGQAGRLQINYKRTMSFDKVHERIPMQSTWGKGRGGVYSQASSRSESWGDYIPDRAGGEDEVDKTGRFFEAEDGSMYYPIITKNSRETFVDENWDLAFQTGTYQDDNLSISGGNQRATYLLSYGRLRQNGIIRNSFLDRDNFRLNSRFNLSSWMTITSKASYITSESNSIQQSSNTAGLLLGLLRTSPDFSVADYKGDYHAADGSVAEGRHRSYRRQLGDSANPSYNNPLWTINEQENTADLNRFIMSSELDITPVKNLSIIVRGGVDNYTDKRVYFWPIFSGDNRISGDLTEDVIANRELNLGVIAKTNYDLNSDLSFQVIAGWGINDRERTRNSSQLQGFLVNSSKQTTDLNTAAENTSISNNKRFIRSNRAYGVLTTDAYDQLFVNFSLAREKTSTIQDSYTYPAVDAAWQFTNYVSNTPLSFGKLRVGWGKVGVQPDAHRFETPAESDFRYSSYSDPLDINLWGGGYRLDDDQGNENLKPEIKTEFEIGTDLRLFDDRFAFSLTHYRNTIKDILLPVSLTPSSGFDTQYQNAGKMQNRGWEFDGSYSILNSIDKQLGINFNWSRNRNKVLDLAGTDVVNLGVGNVNSVARVGFPIGVFWGTGSQTENGKVDGKLILNDLGFPQVTTQAIVLGDPNPDWRGMLGLSARWKSLSLNILLEHSQGGDYSPRTQWVLRRFGTTQETANRIESTPKDLVNYAGDVIPAGSTVRGNIHDFGAGDVLLDETWYRTSIGGGFGDGQAYNFAIKDATYSKIRELSLSYRLGTQGFRNTTRLSSVTFTATARNLFSWYKELVGVDPAVNQSGVSGGFGLDYFTNPSTKSFLFSMSVNY